jgi:hypothetical protein
VAAPFDLGQGAGADADSAGQLSLGQAGGDAFGADLLADALTCARRRAEDVDGAVVADRVPEGAPEDGGGVPVGLEDLQGSLGGLGRGGVEVQNDLGDVGQLGSECRRMGVPFDQPVGDGALLV